MIEKLVEALDRYDKLLHKHITESISERNDPELEAAAVSLNKTIFEARKEEAIAEKMKQEGIFYRTADGREVPIKEVEGLSGAGAIIIQTACMMRPEDAERARKRIEEQFGGGRRVVVLDSTVVRIMRLEE